MKGQMRKSGYDVTNDINARKQRTNELFCYNYERMLI